MLRACLFFVSVLVVSVLSQPRTWGFNYDRTSTGPSSAGGADVTLSELFSALGPAAALSKLSLDFRTMRALNGTSVRLFVNLPDLIAPPPSLSVNMTFMNLVVAACSAACDAGLTVDLTGSTFERQNVSFAWITANDDELLDARAAFWGAAAAALRGVPCVRNFNLVNEPFAPWEDFLADVVTGCIPVVRPDNSTSTFCYLHPLFRHATLLWTRALHNLFPTPDALSAHWSDYPLPGETFDSLRIPRRGDTRSCRYIDYSDFLFNQTSRWCSRLAAAIKSQDPSRLVTVGIQFGDDPDLLTAPACSGSVDFFSVHLYPSADYPTPDALQQFFVTRLNLLPEHLAMNVSWEE